MITSSSISYVSQMLDEPQNINDADAESIGQLIEAYPYFVPARYMHAAKEHKLQPYSPEMMAEMQLFSGNWLLYNEYLQAALNGEEVAYELPKQPALAKKVLAQEEIEDDLPAEDEEDEMTFEKAIEPVATAATLEEDDDEEEEPVTTTNDLAGHAHIEKEDEQVTPVDEYMPENTGFIRGRREQKKEASTAAEPVDEVKEPQPGNAPPKEIFAKRMGWDDNSENLIPPIYTEDYFLHQGMNVSNDIPAGMNKGEGEPGIDGQDKSLMVVMSFSEWLMFYKKKKQQEQEEVKDQKELKTMWQKEKLAAALEEENEEIPENVFEMAVNSITKEENLISESLADVMVKQGRYDRAIDMYKKLSLRKPQKKAYFARKIEEIQKEK